VVAATTTAVALHQSARSPLSLPTGAPPTTTTKCAVAYQVRSTWDTGAAVALAITNNGTVPIHGWSLRFDLETGLKVQAGWNGTWRQDGRHVTIEAAG